MTAAVPRPSLAPLTRGLMVVLMLAFPFAPAAHADTIVFTGAPTNNYSGWLLDDTVWLAGEFTVAQAYTVTSVEGWMFTNVPGDLTVKLYSNGGGIPGTPLFSQTVAVRSFALDWTGATNFQWLIKPSTYFAAFEVQNDSTFSGGMPHPSPNPLLREAYTPPNFPQGEYVEYDALDLGLRILGDPVGGPPPPVPEPSTLALLATVAIGTAGREWKRRRRQA